MTTRWVKSFCYVPITFTRWLKKRKHVLWSRILEDDVVFTILPEGTKPKPGRKELSYRDLDTAAKGAGLK